LFFTNVPMSKILNWDAKSKQLSVFRENNHLTSGSTSIWEATRSAAKAARAT